MSILVSMVRISGFRGISNLEITLPKVAVLIGQNNSGKTSIIKAIQLALGDYSRHLTDEDFYIDKNDVVSTKIIIDILIVPSNGEGEQVNLFSDEWVEEFGEWVQADIEGNDFVAIRTCCEKDAIKGGFKTTRNPLSRWGIFENWTDESVVIKNKITKRIDAIPFVPIEAQRDIHQELREKTSYIGRILSDISFETDDKDELERLISDLNNSAVKKSSVLSDLKAHLNSLSQSFDGQGKTEITPFPKKIRDFSKRFSVHFGEVDANTFSMEYHGMGTRSWASMLTVKAFIEVLEKKHDKEEECFFPIIAAEEPEAHLHPNAQRTLFKQLSEISGQTIISTHSPYLASESSLKDLRSIRNTRNGSQVRSIDYLLTPKDLKKLQRDIMRFRGELLFSRALVLSEGVTEEQIAPIFFEKYFGKTCYSTGINFMSVAGKNYPPFIKLACSLGIPVCIVSDNDGKTKEQIEKQIKKIELEIGFELSKELLSVQFFNPTCDIEMEMVHHVKAIDELRESLILMDLNGSQKQEFIEGKRREINQKSNNELLEIMQANKAKYSAFLGEVILESEKPNQKLIPQAFIDAFEDIKRWSIL